MEQTTTPGGASAVVPAGWYEDPAGQYDIRWWDGAVWTAHTMMRPSPSPVPIAHIQAVAPAQAVPPWSTPYIWLLSALPVTEVVISYLAGLLWGLELGIAEIEILQVLLTLLFVGLFVLLAILDYRALGRFGYQKRAFPALIVIPLIYMLGRAIYVRRVTRKGLAPLLIFVVSVVIFAIVVVAEHATAPAASQLDERQLVNIEQGIQNTLAQQNDIHVTVTCPPDAPATPLNVTFTCTATDSAGNSAPITAHFDAPHHFIFEVPTGLPAGG